MSYLLEGNALSVEELTNLIESNEKIQLSEDLINKINCSSKLLKLYEKKITKLIPYPQIKSLDSSSFLNYKEVKSILLILIYTLANSNSGVKKEVINEIMNYLNRELPIPEISLSLKMNPYPPYYYILQKLKSIDDLEKRIVLQSPGYILGITAIYFNEIEVIRKLLTILFVLIFQKPSLNILNLVYFPYIHLIRLVENINILSKVKNSEDYIDDEILTFLTEVYKLSEDFRELLNIQINSSQFPIIFIPEKKTYIPNLYLNVQKIYLTNKIKELIYYIDVILLKLLEKFSSYYESLIYEVIHKLKIHSSEEILLNLREKIKIYKETISLLLYLSFFAEDNKNFKLVHLGHIFIKKNKITHYVQFIPLLKEFLSFIEEEINELY